jgi:hypothetical protein
MVEDRAIEINVTVRGTYVRGTYSVDAGSITVRSGWWKKSTQIDAVLIPRTSPASCCARWWKMWAWMSSSRKREAASSGASPRPN